MIETIHSILTDASARQTPAVKTALVKSSSAGTPWYNKDK